MVHANHDTSVTGPADDRPRYCEVNKASNVNLMDGYVRENSTRGVIACITISTSINHAKQYIDIPATM